MGANLPSHVGLPEATLAAAAARLASLGRVVCCSSLYSTTPVGFAAQPRFVNAAVALETERSPRELLNALLAIEQEFGRDRAAGLANGPRTLDLDILLFGNLTIDEPDLAVPHPRMAERGFALVPLHEIAPQAVDARSGKTVSQLLQSLFPSPDDAIHAVVQVQSDVWRTGAGRGAALRADAAARATASADHDHDRG
jgi:2-amino-4-hydroxy-6-hydroxymethyldihydropteridine diphosphokinase